MKEEKTSKLKFAADGRANPRAIVQGAHYRFTLLTDRILRLEYDPEGIFEDRPSQVVLHRNQSVPAFRVRDDGERLEIDTDRFHLSYDYRPDDHFTANTLQIAAKNKFTNYGHVFRFGEMQYGDPPRHHNLYGTARTLDRSDGAVPLEFGLLSQAGHAWFDDSESAVMAPDGTFVSRRPGTVDQYYICCQHEYRETLQDFFRISGQMPMLPRWALGNWWSRYWEYTEESYHALMDDFSAMDLPFTVAVVDMDWHQTKIPEKFGKGWTGYTWDRELFPEPRRFLQGLHDRGLHTALNLHPADGVQGNEDAYPQFAAEMGIDPASEEPVVFDFTDPAFIDRYFSLLLHPHEEDGVDFWWIDWQQGRKTKVPGLDPLWLLNHYHYLDNARTGKRGLILSRYSGLGAQRTPVGFSGDTQITWNSLNFQAYFTATASNAAFPWWSHDIGGFFQGYREPELFVRWLQLGVFSPILRLHSSKNPFNGKDPRSFGRRYQPLIEDWLRLRHRLIPYLYTALYQGHTQGVPTVQPLYYTEPDSPAAYEHPNEFTFGSELLVCPITTPEDHDLGQGITRAYLPQGLWTDVFTGKTYRGGRSLVLSRPLEGMPVLAKEGAIVPLAAHVPHSNRWENPEALEVYVFPGEKGAFTLFEDEGDGDAFQSGKAYFTYFALDGNRFSIRGEGDGSLLPKNRRMTLVFRGFEPFTPTGAAIEKVTHDQATHSTIVTLLPWNEEEVTLDLGDAHREENRDREARAEQVLLQCRLGAKVRMDALTRIRSEEDPFTLAQSLCEMNMPKSVCDALFEVLGN